MCNNYYFAEESPNFHADSIFYGANRPFIMKIKRARFEFDIKLTEKNRST